MLECFLATKGVIIILTLLLLLSEALGETKAVKSNGVIHFIVELLQAILKVVKRLLTK